MSTLTIRLSDDLMSNIDRLAKNNHAKRSEFVRSILQDVVEKNKKAQKRERLMGLSKLVRKESMSVNTEFSHADNEIQDET